MIKNPFHYFPFQVSVDNKHQSHTQQYLLLDELIHQDNLHSHGLIELQSYYYYKFYTMVKSMERKVNSIAAELSSSDENTKQKYKKQLKNMHEQLKDIRLKIKLYEKIKKFLDVQISCLDF